MYGKHPKKLSAFFLGKFHLPKEKGPSVVVMPINCIRQYFPPWAACWPDRLCTCVTKDRLLENRG